MPTREGLLLGSCWWVRAFSLTCLYILLFTGWSQAQPAASRPIKLVVMPQHYSISSGEEVNISILLYDSGNNPVRATRDFLIEVVVRPPSGQVTSSSHQLRAGRESISVTLRLDSVGITEILARHRELLNGGTFINVRPRRTGFWLPRPHWRFAEASIIDLVQFSGLAEQKCPLALRATEQRRLANGKDFAEIHAFLLGGRIAREDIHIRLFTSLGTLNPNPLVIPIDKDHGKSELTSDAVGVATVEFISAAPGPVDIDGCDKKDKKLEIPFSPPITKFEVTANPREIHLLDHSELIIQLRDDSGIPIRTDEPRRISLSIKDGQGVLNAKEIEIPEGSSAGRADFYPTWWDKVSIHASTPDLEDQTAHIDVLVPYLLLVLSALGGAMGGLIASWVEQDSTPWRLIIGLITGIMLYWAFIFGVLPFIPHQVVLHPFSAVVLPICGGFLGIKIFNLILKQLGVQIRAADQIAP